MPTLPDGRYCGRFSTLRAFILMGVNDGDVERREIRRNEGNYGRRGAFGAQGCGERSQVFLAIQAEAGRPIGLHDSTSAGQTSRTGKGREGRKALPLIFLLRESFILAVLQAVDNRAIPSNRLLQYPIALQLL